MKKTNDGSYPVPRNLDGVYYRTKRNGKIENICFSDLTVAEREDAIKDYEAPSLKRLCLYLAACLRNMGDELDVYSEK